MITLSVGHLNNDLFWGYIELFEQQPLPMKTALNLVKLKKKLLSEAKDYADVYKGILHKHCEVDDSGQIKSKIVKDQGLDKPQPILKEGANKEEYLAELDEFLKQQVEINFEKFNLEDFKDVEVPAKALYLLKPILEV